MHEFMNNDCEKCSKFSHCNNNNLICISRYRAKQQECEELRSELNCAYRQVEDFDIIARFKCKKLNNYKQVIDEIKKICHRKTDGLYPKTNPLKDILHIIENESCIDK